MNGFNLCGGLEELEKFSVLGVGYCVLCITCYVLGIAYCALRVACYVFIN